MDIYRRAEAIDWFANCGELSLPQFGIPVRRLENQTSALQSMFSVDWADATTIAQGSLSKYLAKHHYESYAGSWNNLLIKSQSILDTGVTKRILETLNARSWPKSLANTPLPEITPAVRASIGKQMADRFAAKAWDQCLSSWVLGHINLAALELTYRRKFPKAPVFFERLLQVYEAGRLPCGWEGDLDNWPEGSLLVY